MRKEIFHRIGRLVIGLLLCLPALQAKAQEGLHIARLFEQYGDRPNVTRVELNGSILKSYRMTTYKSLVFKEVSPYREEIQQALAADKQQQLQKAQEVVEGGLLLSAYYRLDDVTRRGQSVKRYILFKCGKEDQGTLIYIEGTLSERELMEMLYKK